MRDVPVVLRQVEPLAHGVGDDAADALDAGELLAGWPRGWRPSTRSAGPAPGPRWARRGGSTDATSTRQSGCCLAVCRLATSRLPLADSTRPSTTASSGSVFFAARVYSGTRAMSGLRQAEQGALVLDHPGLEQSDRALPAEGLDVEGARARPARRSAPAAAPGRTRALGQRMSLSPSFSGASVRAARGAVRRHDELALAAVAQVDDRPEDLGDDVTGLAQHHGVADEHALALDLVRVVQGGHSTVEPATTTGSMTPNGVTRPVRPTLTWMSRSLVLTSSGGYL